MTVELDDEDDEEPMEGSFPFSAFFVFLIFLRASRMVLRMYWKSEGGRYGVLARGSYSVEFGREES